MANITAAEVNKLRKMTGAGMMDCKNALVESDGDFEKAIDILRKKGQKVASKRAEKEANEGIVLAKTNDGETYAAVVKISCETDFVAKNEEFVGFANRVMDKVLQEKPADVEALKSMKLNDLTVEEGLTEMVGKTGEKMELAGFASLTAEKATAYNHMGNKLATILGLNKSDNTDEIGHQLAMQVAAMSPVAIDKDSVPQEVIDKELEIGREQALAAGKPENMLDRIAQGKLGKFFKENTLLSQDFVRDTKITVGDYLKQTDKDLKVTEFHRLMLGE